MIWRAWRPHGDFRKSNLSQDKSQLPQKWVVTLLDALESLAAPWRTVKSFGGSKVKAGELSFSIWAAFVGYTFTLTFAVQGLVNTLGDLRGSLASVERINSVLSGVGIDEALAFGLEGELKQKRNG
ncbi:hypothetical protein L6164_006259 [Bauhinia variegata]|uniref:Uncharacterized protein n=1 Tax=Bauhinia variegata TaxID=167791 RepID=A0ACB9PWJ7_BAUVA|nr:hypothetical protein L6164_006259 [Bauhinia variegata]